jgi:hypothetical protein
MATRMPRAADINEPEGVLASLRCRAVLGLGRISGGCVEQAAVG